MFKTRFINNYNFILLMVDFVKLKDENNDEKKKSKKFSFKKILLIFLFFFFLSSIISAINYSISPKIGVVKISSPIMTQKSTSLYGTSISSREISQILKDLEKDDSVKAVIIDINSPGGSPVASEEISNAIVSLKKTKPVYGLINDVGASGAFWIAVSTNKIYASPMSIVGSIGVTSATLGFEDFIKNYNITYRGQIAGKYKDLGSPFKKPSKEENKIIQNILNQIHTKFISHIANSRNLTFDYVKQYATGEIFLGEKAKKLGFIDELGYYPNVIKDLKKKIDSKREILIVDYEPQKTLFEELGLSTFSNFLPSTESRILLK